MDLMEYRRRDSERQRAADLMALVPVNGGRALDVGARDGHFSRLFAERFSAVTALDLEQPRIDCARVECVRGDVTGLPYEDDHFDFVFCAEVLEHIPRPLLERACSELSRVCGGKLLIGVPYRQDIRVGRTTCPSCRTNNPPWGHVNRFDDANLEILFSGLTAERVSYVGINDQSTNLLARILMDWAGNPFGTYEQDEPCLHCGGKLVPPKSRSIPQRVAARLAVHAQSLTRGYALPHANWIHMLFRKGKAMPLGVAAE